VNLLDYRTSRAFIEARQRSLNQRHSTYRLPAPKPSLRILNRARRYLGRILIYLGNRMVRPDAELS
jgi:hypothetical protein